MVENALKDRTLRAKLAFFISSASSVEPFLREFQCDAPMAPFLLEELSSLIRSVMGKVLKPECLKVKAKSFTDIELSESNMLTSAHVNIGLELKRL